MQWDRPQERAAPEKKKEVMSGTDHRLFSFFAYGTPQGSVRLRVHGLQQKTYGGNPSLQEIIADRLFFIQPS